MNDSKSDSEIDKVPDDWLDGPALGDGDQDSLSPAVPMTREYVDSQDVVRRYVSGKLQTAELESFELLFLDDQQLLEEIEIETALRDGVVEEVGKSITPSPNLATPDVATLGGRPQGPPSHSATWFRGAFPSLAMAAALVVSIGLLAQMSSTISSLNAQLDEPVFIPSAPIRLGKARGALEGGECDGTANVSQGQSALLHLEVGPLAEGPFAVSISGPTGGERTASDLEADADYALMMVFDATEPGQFRVQILRQADRDIVAQYCVQVVAN